MTLVLFGVLWIASGRIVSPVRKEIDPAHQEWLDQPSSYAIQVSQHTFYHDSVPTLIVKPDPASQPAERGRLIRRQLIEREHSLPEFGAKRGLFVILHGRNGRKEDMLPVAERFCAAGFVCVLPDLPAHGESPMKTVAFGSSDFEKHLAGGVAEEAAAIVGGDLPQFLWGMSMGGSFAIHSAAAEPDRWQRLIIVSSFDQLDGVIHDQIRSFSGPLASPLTATVRAMVSSRSGFKLQSVRPIDLISSIKIPTLIIHGDADDLISYERGTKLFNALPGDRKFLTVPGGTHSNVLITEAPVFATAAGWLLN